MNYVQIFFEIGMFERVLLGRPQFGIFLVNEFEVLHIKFKEVRIS